MVYPFNIPFLPILIVFALLFTKWGRTRRWFLAATGISLAGLFWTFFCWNSTASQQIQAACDQYYGGQRPEHGCLGPGDELVGGMLLLAYLAIWFVLTVATYCVLFVRRITNETELSENSAEPLPAP